MTRQEFDETFQTHYKELFRFLNKRCDNSHDAEDMVMQAYVRNAERNEWHKLDVKHARSWWVYQVREEFQALKQQRAYQFNAIQRWLDDPSLNPGEGYTPLYDVEAISLLESQWDTYNKSKQSRMRVNWRKEGIPLFPFMEEKK